MGRRPVRRVPQSASCHDKLTNDSDIDDPDWNDDNNFMVSKEISSDRKMRSSHNKLSNSLPRIDIVIETMLDLRCPRLPYRKYDCDMAIWHSI